MRILNVLAVIAALLLATGEIARFWGDPRFFPMAADEFLVAGLLLWAAARRGAAAARSHLLAWSLFSGFVLVLLVETADRQLHGPVKEAGSIYLAALLTLFLIGLWAIRRAYGRVPPGRG